MATEHTSATRSGALGKAMPEFEGVDERQFREEIVPEGKPAVLRGLVSGWAPVKEANISPEGLVHYLSKFDSGKAVEVLMGPPDIEGRFFYNDRLDGLNFTKKSRTLSGTLDRLLAARGQPRPRALYLQSQSVHELLPGLEQHLALPVALAETSPRIWIGNRLSVQTHYDLNENLACVMAGRRRFTLFPPEQIANFYSGPFERTVAGTPVSMVRLEAPDMEAYPRFADASASAQFAELGPGDALFIPYLWWHHVESLEDFNVLVNFWWSEADPSLGSPYDVMLHALLGLRDLPEHQRDAWRVMFDHYIFQKNGDPMAHLPEYAHGTLGAHSDQDRQRIRMILLDLLARQAGLRRN